MEASGGTWPGAEPGAELQLFETLRATRGEGAGGAHSYALLGGHLRRLRASCSYFGFAYDARRVRAALDAALDAAAGGADLRVRVTVSRDGAAGAVVTGALPPLVAAGAAPPEAAAAAGAPLPALVLCASRPVHSRSVLLYHKTTLRRAYDEARARCGCGEGGAGGAAPLDALLVNERGEVTECCIGSFVYEMEESLALRGVPVPDEAEHEGEDEPCGEEERDDAAEAGDGDGVAAAAQWPRPAPGHRLLTPPVACGLLPGVLRARLLAAGRVALRALAAEELLRGACTRAWLASSVRGFVQVRVEREGEGECEGGAGASERRC
jgi:para-aminobenzoate synthetase/4-amino-4-deoxychorismate lyase